MAKDHYKIPVSLDRSFLDHEITLTGGGWQAKPMPMKQLLFFGGSVLVMLWVMTSTFLGSAGFLLGFFTVAWWIAATIFFGGVTKTREMRFKTVAAFLAYAPKAARNVLVRTASDPSGFYSIVGIDAIDENGLITFADGTVGQGYLVVGSASILLFDEDRIAILDRVDNYWRKVETNVDYCFITTKEPQRIYQQVASLEGRNQALRFRDPDLIELLDEQYDILTQHVGGRFNSIHQYLLLKGDTRDALKRGHTILQAEADGSNLMIKECSPLDREETYRMLRVFYQGTEANPLTMASSMD